MCCLREENHRKKIVVLGGMGCSLQAKVDAAALFVDDANSSIESLRDELQTSVDSLMAADAVSLYV